LEKKKNEPKGRQKKWEDVWLRRRESELVAKKSLPSAKKECLVSV